MSIFLAGMIGALLGGLLVAMLRRPRDSGTANAADAGEAASPNEHTTRLAHAGRNLAAVAHELNNPLAAILAFAQDLLHDEPTAEQREALLVIQQQARRSRMIVRGLLDAVHAAPLPAEPVDPRELVGRVAIVFDRQCREQGIGFDWSADDALPSVEGDATGLEQVLTNLLQNAVQATPAGGRITLSIRVRGRLLELVVQDSGPGIPADLLGRIFDPFFTTKPAGEGTGLGLSVSQGIIRRHRGTLVAENVPAWEGGGARLIVSLPFQDRRRDDREPAEEPDSPPAQPADSPRRVLVVEDEVAIRVSVRRFLERRGWAVVEAGDGTSALGELQGSGFDAVLCDLRLPGLSGMELYDRLSASDPALAARMVLISGDAATPEIRAFLARTHALMLEKPFELRALARALDRVAGGAGRRST
jgi:CheY-like chemotaxis protein